MTHRITTNSGEAHDSGLEQVLMQAIDAVVTIDENNIVTFFNPAAEQLWGYEAAEVLGRNVKMLVPPEMQSQHDGFVDANRRTGQNRIVGTFREVPVHCKGGTVKWGSLSLSKANVDGKWVYTAFLRDITEERRIRDGLTNEAASVMRAIAAGDLRHRIVGDYGESMAELTGAINECADALASMITSIRASADEIDLNAGEVARGNQHLRARTEEQASSLEETSASMEEMTRTVASTAANLKEVAALSSQAQQVAHSGHEEVRKAVDAMASIAEASQKVNDIISVIDEIAFQTNLLALNAAVEAARAGEQGRGFAVVASEVRALAQRSASAAKEIKQLIGSNMERVSVGTRLVNDSGRTLDQIVQSVVKVNEITNDTARSSDEQSEGIAQINRAVAQMDKITQETAGLADGAASASDALRTQAGHLRELVDHFRAGATDDTGAGHGQGVAPPRYGAAPAHAGAAHGPAANGGGGRRGSAAA